MLIVFSVLINAQVVNVDANCESRASTALNEGSRLTDKGQPDKGADYYRLAIQYDPKCGAAYNNLGAYYSEQKKYLEAIFIYRKALEIDQKLAWLYNFNLGNSYLALGKLDQAAQAYGEVMRLKHKEADLLLPRANLYLRLGQGASAAADAQMYLKLKGWRDKNSQYAALFGYLGYRQANCDEDARALLLESVKSDKSQWAYQIIRYLNQEITDQQLITLAIDQGKMTEAKTYIGMNLSLSGKKMEAIDYLHWVKENGNQDYYEYKIALSELERIDK